jgi:hypothetical protein
MPEPPELDELARRFLDLWQQQLSAWATDPELARQMGNFMAFATASVPKAPFWPGAVAPGGSGDGIGGAEAADGAPQRGAAPARAASRGRGVDLGELAQRLAAIERRLARMESGARGTGGSARKGARKRRS